jgi:hypothetical protein
MDLRSFRFDAKVAGFRFVYGAKLAVSDEGRFK